MECWSFFNPSAKLRNSVTALCRALVSHFLNRPAFCCVIIRRKLTAKSLTFPMSGHKPIKRRSHRYRSRDDFNREIAMVGVCPMKVWSHFVVDMGDF